MDPTRHPVIERWIAPLAVGVGLALVAALTMTAFVGVGRDAGDTVALEDSSHPGLPSRDGTSAPLLFPAPPEEPVEAETPTVPVLTSIAEPSIPVAAAPAPNDDASDGRTLQPPRPDAPTEPDGDDPLAAPSGDDDGESTLAGRGPSKGKGGGKKNGGGKPSGSSKPDDDGDEGHPAKSNGGNGKVPGAHGDGKKGSKGKSKGKAASHDNSSGKGPKGSSDDAPAAKNKSKGKPSKAGKENGKGNGPAKPKGGGKKGKKGKK